MPNKKAGTEGSSLVELLIAISIMALVVVSILSGFTQHQMSAKHNEDKNAALSMAEERLEELLKFPAGQLSDNTVVDYVTFKKGVFETYDSDPLTPNQFRRTSTVDVNVLGDLATIEVVVDYGAIQQDGDEFTYPFQVSLSSVKGE